MKKYSTIILAAIAIAMFFTALFFLNKTIFLSLLSMSVVLGLAVIRPQLFRKKTFTYTIENKVKKYSFYLPKLVLKNGVIVVIILSSFVLIGLRSKAQFVVSDPIADNAAIQQLVNQAQQLMQAVNQTEQLYSSVTILGQTRDVFQKISSTIKQATAIKNLLNKQTNLILNCNTAMHSLDSYRALGQSGSVDTYQSKVNLIIDRNQDYVEQLQHVINEGDQNMTDGERAQLVNKITESTDLASDNLVTLQDRYSESMALGNFYGQLKKANP